MVELFKGSARHLESLLQRQCETLRSLDQTLPEARNAKWLAARDFALSAARDVLKEVLPPDSATYANFVRVATATPVPNPLPVIDQYELELLSAAVRQIAWDSPSTASGKAPALESDYHSIHQLLPQLIYQHWTFKFIIAALVALGGVAAVGVFKFQGITVDIGEQIQKKERYLDEQFDKQRQKVDAALTDRRKESEDLGAELKRLRGTSSDVSAQLEQLQITARRSLEKFLADAQFGIGSEADKAMPKVREAINSEYRKAEEALRATAATRVQQVLTFDPGAAFQKKVIEFDARTVDSTKVLDGLADKAKAVDQRVAAVERGASGVEGRLMALERAARLIGNRSPDITDRLAAYFGEAVRYVVGAAIAGALAFIVFTVLSVILLVKLARARNQPR